MKDKPLMLSLLFGFIMVLVIVSVSFLVKMNSLSGSEKKLQTEKLALETSLEGLKKENALLVEKNSSLTDDIAKALAKVEELKTELNKLEKLKDKLEENLKEELVKQVIKEKK
jgi:uncharacterized protein YoxC